MPGKEQEYIRQLRRITYSLDEHPAGATNERETGFPAKQITKKKEKRKCM
jgi:hypothetical protein